MKKSILIICTLWFGLIALKSLAQQNKEVDSLLNLSISYWSRDADSAHFLAEKAYSVSTFIEDKNLMGKSRVAKAAAKLIQGEFTTTENLLNRNLLDSIYLEDSTIGSTYSFLGYTLFNKNYSEASKAFLKAIPFFQKGNDSTNLAIVYNGLGMIQTKLKREQEANEYFQSVLKYNFRKDKYKNVCVYISTQMSMAELNSNRKEAEKIFSEAVELAKRNKVGFFIPTIYEKFSHYYLQNSRYAKAIEFAKKALIETKKMGLGGEEQLIFRDIGTAYYLNKQYNLAIENYLKALPNARMEVKDTVYKRLSMSYYKLNDKKNGEYYLNKFLTHSDSIQQFQNSKAVAEIIEKYESDKKDLEIKLLEKENIAVTDENNRQKKQLLFALLLVFLLALITIIIWQFYSREKQQNEILFAKNQELIITKKNKTQFTSDSNCKQKVDIDLVHSLEKIMADNLFLDKELSLSKLANLLKTNTTYLSNAINGYYKKKFADFINQYRTDYVLSRLETDLEFQKYTIEHIADISGFNSSSAFYKAFKKNTGLTPAYYIKRKLQGPKSNISK